MSETKSVNELSAMAALAWKEGDFQMAARLHAQCRTNVETADPSARVVQLDDGRIALCTAEELASSGGTGNPSAFHAALKAKLDGVDKEGK